MLARRAARFSAALLALGLLGACAADFRPEVHTFDAGVGLPPDAVSAWSVKLVEVVVSPELSISNDPKIRFPYTDIVWWEDEEGDRRAQVAAVMREAITAAVAPLDGPMPVILKVTVHKFHALTPEALKKGDRGWHDVNFDIEVRDSTGRVLAAETGIDADIKALQGAASEAALAKGETQRSRIVARVSSVLRYWLRLA